jgi:hypothetical protein
MTVLAANTSSHLSADIKTQVSRALPYPRSAGRVTGRIQASISSQVKGTFHTNDQAWLTPDNRPKLNDPEQSVPWEHIAFYSSVMAVWVATVWGLTGGLCMEALELYAHIRHAPKWDWRSPIDQGMVAFVVAVVLRVGVGSALAAVFAGSHQVSSPLVAFTLGVAAPMVVARLAKAIPLTDGQDDPNLSTAVAHHTASVGTATVPGASHGRDKHVSAAKDVTAGESDAH